jgi:hypothetical protein
VVVEGRRGDMYVVYGGISVCACVYMRVCRHEPQPDGMPQSFQVKMVPRFDFRLCLFSLF